MKGQQYLAVWVFLFASFAIGATNSPSGGVNPEIQQIQRVISDALEVRSEYIDLQKAKKYHFKSLDVDVLNEWSVEDEVEDKLEDVYRKNNEYVDNPKVQKVMAAVNGLNAENMIDQLSKFDLVKLPLGITKTFGNTSYTIVFDKAKIFSTYAELRVYGRIKNEKIDLCFGAEDVKFSFEGGIIGDATLALFGDFAVPMKNQRIGLVFNQFNTNSLDEKSGSFITFDCDGFVEAGLDVDIILSREWVLPTDNNGQILGNGLRVEANVAAIVSSLDDFVAEASMPYFTLTRDTSVSVMVSRATFDYSETKNARNFEHPLLYDIETGTYENPPSTEELPLWKGFYVQQIEFALPHVFKTSDDQPLIIGAKKLYIDQAGVSAYVYGDGLIPIETGTIGESGWAFSLDHAGVQINYNRIINFDFDGRINIPINKETQRLNYTAYGFPSQNHYSISVGLDSTMTFPVFKAGEVKLSRGSEVFVDVRNNKFIPGATLCGGMYVSIGGSSEDDGKVNLDMPGVEFHKLQIRDTLPYLQLDTMGGSITLKIPPILNNSPITIDQLSLVRNGSKNVKLGFAVEVNVQASESGGGKTGGAFGVLGEYKQVNGKYKWAYAGVEVDAMSVEIVMGTYLWISGGLEFFKGDEIWGNGFYGYLEGGILAQDAEDGGTIGSHNEYKVRMQASTRFGTKFAKTPEEYRYWAYDFYVSSSEKLFDIYPPIHAKGIGGGVYHHMRMYSYNMQQMAQGAGQNPYSGIEYRPDAGTLFGVKVSLGVGIEGVDGFKANCTLELAIDSDFALQNIMLYGNGEFASDKFKIDALSKVNDLLKDKDKADEDNIRHAQANNQNKILAAVMIYMDFEKGFELQGNFGAYLNAADGVIVGESNVDLYISAQEQHIYIGGYEGLTNLNGEPIPESSVSLDLGGFKVHAKFYLCTGSKLPPPPPVPHTIASAFGQQNSDNRASLPTSTDQLAAGFALGASIAIKIDIRTSFIRFYFDFLSGFDFSMLSNPSSSYCSAVGSQEQGINGWRAKGNIFGSLFIEIQIKNLAGRWRTRYRQDIKVWLKADVPKPAYFFIKYKYNNWRGKEKNKDFEYGEKCGQVLKS